jgi:hypothetical protein
MVCQFSQDWLQASFLDLQARRTQPGDALRVHDPEVRCHIYPAAKDAETRKQIAEGGIR